MTIRYFKNNIVGYRRSDNRSRQAHQRGAGLLDDDRFDRNSKDETERIAAAFVQLVIATREKVADTKQTPTD